MVEIIFKAQNGYSSTLNLLPAKCRLEELNGGRLIK
jgi:hypothetical protein